MSWLLTENEYKEARGAIARGEVSEPLVAFLARLIGAVARSGTVAPSLSPTGRWAPEDHNDIFHTWLLDGGLLEGGLLQSFDVAASPRALSRYLETAFRNWLVSRSRRTSEPRLLVRAREILEADERFRRFVESRSWLDHWWGLAEWEEPAAYDAGDQPLVRRVFELGDFAILRYAADRADPVISNADLTRLLVGLFERTGKTLTLRHVRATLRGRFAFAFDDTPVDIDAVAEPEGRDVAPDEHLVVEETAFAIVAALTERQLAIFNDRIDENLTLEELASRYGVSRGTADNELRRVGAIIREHVVDDDNFNLIVEKVIDLAFHKGGERDG